MCLARAQGLSQEGIVFPEVTGNSWEQGSTWGHGTQALGPSPFPWSSRRPPTPFSRPCPLCLSLS